MRAIESIGTVDAVSRNITGARNAEMRRGSCRMRRNGEKEEKEQKKGECGQRTSNQEVEKKNEVPLRGVRAESLCGRDRLGRLPPVRAYREEIKKTAPQKKQPEENMMGNGTQS